MDKQNVESQRADEEQDGEGRKENLLLKQTFANSAPILIHVAIGMVAGYSAILLPQLENEESILHPTKDQESWIASLAPLPMAFGCIFSGLSMDRIGRRSTIILSTLISSIGWTIIYFSPNIKILLIGRILTGLSVGYSGVCLSSFIGEISHPKYRGIFLGSMAMGISMGTFICHLLGIFFSWRNVILFILALQLICIAIMLFVPESHIWYLNKNSLDEAKASFNWFRGYSEESKAELEKLIFEKIKQPAKPATLRSVLEKCRKQRFIKPFSILILLFVLSQTTGSNAVIFYSVQIMQSTVEGIDKYTATLSVDALRVFMSVFACVLIKKFRTRLLAMVSGIGTTLSLYSLSLFIYLTAKYPENKLFGIIPLICFMSYIIFVSVGLIPLAWSLLGEILPPETKGVGGGVSSTVNFLMFFVVVKTNPDLIQLIGSSGTFAIYGFCTMVGTILLYFYLPETRGKTLDDIQMFFMSRMTIMGDGEELKKLNEKS